MIAAKRTRKSLNWLNLGRCQSDGSLPAFHPGRMIKVVAAKLARPASISRFIFLCLVTLGMSLAVRVHGQTAAVLGWSPPLDSSVAGFYLYYGTASGQYTSKINVGNTSTYKVPNLTLGLNYFFTVSSYTTDGTESELSAETTLALPKSLFFMGQVDLGQGVDYLQFPDGNSFGYYSLTGYPWIFHFDLGYEYVINAKDGQNGVYLYDLSSKTYWYTTPVTFPYIYDFALGSWIYYYADTSNPGRYTSNPRYFFDFRTSQIITK
jgi:hypothetical protein